VYLLAQHGSGKTDKVEQGLVDHNVDGVVVSPRHESPTHLKGWVDSLRRDYPSALIMFDPEFYVGTFPGASEGRLPDYPYFRTDLRRRDFAGHDSLQAYASETLDYQISLVLDRLVAPTVYVDNLNGAWAQVALSLMSEARSYHKSLNTKTPLILQICIAEEVLQPGQDLDEFLDTLTAQSEIAGFYISVSRPSLAGDPAMSAEHLGCLMYLTHVLSAINGLETHLAYSSFLAVPLSAVGATSCSCGWFNSLRRFSILDLMPRGGSHPREKYSSAPLLNSILRTPELTDMAGVLGMDSVFSHTEYDADLMKHPDTAVWSPRTSALHHWAVLRQLVHAIESQGDLDSRLKLLSTMIGDAKSSYAEYNSSDRLRLQTKFGHLDEWNGAVATFRDLLAR
jgi:hypothetical protein